MFEDVNAGPKDFSDNHLLVSDVWSTVQGEMPNSGRWAVFLRLAGCNRGKKGKSCGVACDTDFRMSNAKSMTISEVVDLVVQQGNDLFKETAPLLVITGGEPLLQQKALFEFLRCFPKGWTVQFETNGEFWDSAYEFDYPNVQIVVSPKRTVGGKYGVLRIPPARIFAFRCVINRDIDRQSHIPCILLADTNPALFKKPLYLSPETVYASSDDCPQAGWTENIDRQETAKNYSYAMEYSLQLMKAGRQNQLSMQTHLFFGAI